MGAKAAPDAAAAAATTSAAAPAEAAEAAVGEASSSSSSSSAAAAAPSAAEVPKALGAQKQRERRRRPRAYTVRAARGSMSDMSLTTGRCGVACAKENIRSLGSRKALVDGAVCRARTGPGEIVGVAGEGPEQNSVCLSAVSLLFLTLRVLRRASERAQERRTARCMARRRAACS